MKTPFAVLAGRVRIWLPPLLFLLVNLGVVLFDRLVLAERATRLEANRTQLAAEHETLVRRRSELAVREAAVQAEQARRATLFAERFGRPEERLTAAIAEVKDLARRAGLDIRAISYPEERLVELGLARRSFVFSVEGSYAELRQLIYLIELTPSFLTLEQLSVGEAGASGNLRADLRLSTLFTAPESATPRAGRGGAS